MNSRIQFFLTPSIAGRPLLPVAFKHAPFPVARTMFWYVGDKTIFQVGVIVGFLNDPGSVGNIFLGFIW